MFLRLLLFILLTLLIVHFFLLVSSSPLLDSQKSDPTFFSHGSLDEYLKHFLFGVLNNEVTLYIYSLQISGWMNACFYSLGKHLDNGIADQA